MRWRRTSWAVMAVLPLSLAATASAQTRAGVPAEGLIPDGMRLLEVRAPDTMAGAVRLSFAPSGQSRPELILDVWVEGDAERAGRRVRWLRETVSGHLAEVPGIGESAWGDDGFVVLRRANIALRVRAVGSGMGALAAARHMDRAVRAAPAGAPRAAACSVVVPGDLQIGASAPIELRGDPLAAHISVEGEGFARRSRSGWVLTRTGDGPLRVRVVAVDSLLRLRLLR